MLVAMPHPDLGWTPSADLDVAQADGRFFARLGGLLEWLCPYCTGLNRSFVDRAAGRVQCAQISCRRVVGVGLSWTDAPLVDPRAVPPFNATFTRPMVTADGTFHNQVEPSARALDASPGARPAIARLAGPIEWRCQCSAWNMSYADWSVGALTCSTCHVTGRVRALLHDVTSLRRRTPADWYGLFPLRSDVSVDKRRLRLTRTLRKHRTAS
jgi:hypothetical protein